MSTVQKSGARRHSFAALSTHEHRHKHIPYSTTSHPDNPIPIEPIRSQDMNIPLDAQVRLSNLSLLAKASPRSSGDSIAGFSDDTAASDSEAPSTPATDAADTVDLPVDRLKHLSSSQAADQPRKRRASTTYASNVDDIRRLIGPGGGTKFLQKYCCGEGCCMIESLPLHGREEAQAPIITPSTEAYRFLNLDLRSLSLSTQLTKIVDLPDQRVSFGAIRRQSISEKFPEEAGHKHDAAEVQEYPPEYMRPHPPYKIFSAPLYCARELTKPGAEKRTFHFDIDVTDYPEEGGVDFKVGGAVGVCPPNDPAVVEDIMEQLCIPRFQRDRAIRLHTTGGRWPTIWGDEAARELVTTRREILTWTVDISSTAPTKPLLRVLAEYAGEPNERKILEYMCSAQGQATFCDLRTGPHITLQQLLHAFPSSKPPLETLCSCLNQLMPRFYSLSNDPHVSSAREGIAGRRLIEVAVTVHETDNFRGDKRSGVGSGFLERLASRFIEADEKGQREAESKGFYLQQGVAGRKLNLHVPMFRGLMANPLSKEFISDGPMVLIGAGVGMAPFRGFILNRLKNANCANKIWLIQGIRDSMLDEIYRGELGDHEHDIKKVVQSRAALPPVSEDDAGVAENADDDSKPAMVTDPGKKDKVAKYVQDEVRHQADIVWFVINSLDGRIFVCGSSKGMGEGVEAALIDVAMDKGNLDYETARQFWEGKKSAGQYIAETW